jgi:H+/Cl- antiporter ClcA
MTRMLLLAAALGVAIALVFVSFEWAVNHGTNWIWNDFAGTDEHRWRVLVLAPVLGIAYSAVVRACGQPRVVPVHTDLMANAAGPPSTTFRAVVVALVIGLASLLAGASLGPEAALVAASAGLGGWLAVRASSDEQARLLSMAGIGALLVAFFASLVMLLVPLLVVYQRAKKLPLAQVGPIVTASVTAYVTLWLVKGGEGEGFGSAPVSSNVRVRDYFLAVVVGVLAAVAGHVLHRCLLALAPVAKRVDARLPWVLTAMCFGLVLGLLYLIGGQTEEFSGSAGSHELIAKAPTYSALALAGLLLVKLAATGWSSASGYRGGLVFPSIYAGVALGLLVARVASGASGPGVVVGALIGILTAMTGVGFAGVITVALIPLDTIGLAVVSLVGAALATRVLEPKPKPSATTGD